MKKVILLLILSISIMACTSKSKQAQELSKALEHNYQESDSYITGQYIVNDSMSIMSEPLVIGGVEDIIYTLCVKGKKYDDIYYYHSVAAINGRHMPYISDYLVERYYGLHPQPFKFK